MENSKLQDSRARDAYTSSNNQIWRPDALLAYLFVEALLIHETIVDSFVVESDGGQHVIRLLSYIPGDRMATVPYTPKLLHRFGLYIGAIDRALEVCYMLNIMMQPSELTDFVQFRLCYVEKYILHLHNLQPGEAFAHC
jgi:hypothetical protein